MAEQDGLPVTEPTGEDPTPDPFAALEGFDVKSFIAGDEPAPAPEPKTPDPAPAMAELESLRAEITQLQQNANQQHANWNAEHMARKNAEEFVNAMRQVRYEEQNQANAMAAQQPPPTNVDWTEIYDDPEKMGEAIQRMSLSHAEWARNQALGYAYPHMQQLQAVSNVLGPLQSAGIESMLDRAEMKLRNEHGVEDFHEYRDRIRDEFLKGGADGVALLNNPENVVTVYGGLAIQGGRPFNPQEKSAEPIHAGGDPSFNRQAPQGPRTALSPELSNVWDRMAPSFTLTDGSRVEKPSPDDLDEAGIEWSGSQR